jgi:hypothetical protein
MTNYTVSAFSCFIRNMKVMVSCFLGISMFIVTSALGWCGQVPEEDMLVNVELENKNLSEALSIVAERLNISIVFHGDTNDVKHNILLTQLPLGQAVDKIMRYYGVENHSMIYKSDDDRLVKVDVYGYQSNKSGGVSQILVRENDQTPVSTVQLNRLMKQSATIETEENENTKPLSQRQLTQFLKQSKRIEAEENKNTGPLTPEQLARMKDVSDRIEAEEKENSGAL